MPTIFERQQLAVNPPFEQQTAFFDEALRETAGMEDPIVRRDGVYAADFKAVDHAVDQGLAEVGPDLTQEYLISLPEHRTLAVTQAINKMSVEERAQLRRIREERKSLLDQLADTKLVAGVKQQTIADDALNVPPYAEKESPTSCTNACFRMVFAGITGQMPRESVVERQLDKHRDSKHVDDVEYRRVFASDVFRRRYEKEVVMIELTGGTLRTINTLATNIRQRHPDARVYSMLNIASDRTNPDVWHSVVLLGTSFGAVVCHDPAHPPVGGEFKHYSAESFVRRWAVTRNRAQLFIARPTSVSTR